MIVLGRVQFVSFLAIFITFLNSIEASPITFNTATPVAENEIMLRVQYSRLRSSDDPSNANRNFRVEAATTTLGYGTSNKLALFVVFPYS
ncbi:MAG: hypothetical protein COA99_15650, partial [Moraxellaceae bacterium]